MTTFAEAYGVARTRTIVGEARCKSLWNQALRTAEIPGDVVELGTYRGGTLYLLAAACAPRKVYGIDTFRGMPKKARVGVDLHKAGDFADTSIEVVRAFVASLPNAIPVPLTFPEEFRPKSIPGPFSLAHFDGDLLESCRAFLDFVLPRLSPGGVVVFDDYRWERCPGVEKAIEERGLPIVQTAPNQGIYERPRL